MNLEYILLYINCIAQWLSIVYPIQYYNIKKYNISNVHFIHFNIHKHIMLPSHHHPLYRLCIIFIHTDNIYLQFIWLIVEYAVHIIRKNILLFQIQYILCNNSMIWSPTTQIHTHRTYTSNLINNRIGVRACSHSLKVVYCCVVQHYINVSQFSSFILFNKIWA